MDETDVYERQGFRGRVGFGRSPAVLVVDFQVGFLDPDVFGGGNIADAAARTRDLLAAARAAGVPIAFTRVVYAADGADDGVFTRKAPGLSRLTEEAEISRLDPALGRRPGEIVVGKTQPSAFFGTGLAGHLVARGIDTLVVAGCTTSGCVRASVVDAMSFNFRPIVVTDCVGDRAAGPHEANLFDMDQKYADLATCDEVADRLAACADGRTAEGA